MKTKATRQELVVSDARETVFYLEQHGSTLSDRELTSIISAHLWRKSTPRRFIREKRWFELARLLDDMYVYAIDALRREVLGRAMTRDEIARYGARCAIVQALADIIRHRIRNA